MSVSLITAIASGVVSIVAAVTSLVVAIKARKVASAATATFKELKTIPESGAKDSTPPAV